MLASFLMGLVGGQRSMTPLAAISVAAACGRLRGNEAPGVLAHPAIAAGALALASAELAGDKMPFAPDRIVTIGLAARLVTGAVAGASLAPRRDRSLAAALGGATAVGAAFAGWRLRVAAISRHGQVRTGLVEDALVVAAAAIVLWAARQLEASKAPWSRTVVRDQNSQRGTDRR